MAMLKNLCRVKTRHSSWKYSPSLSSTEREEGREREEQTRGKLTNGSFDAAWFRSTSELSFVSRTPGIPEEGRRRRYIGEGGWLRCLIYIYKKKESTWLQLRNRAEDRRKLGEKVQGGEKKYRYGGAIKGCLIVCSVGKHGYPLSAFELTRRWFRGLLPSEFSGGEGAWRSVALLVRRKKKTRNSGDPWRRNKIIKFKWRNK